MSNSERVAAENECRARLEADVFVWAETLKIPRRAPADGFGPRTARAIVQVMGQRLLAAQDRTDELEEEVARLRAELDPPP